MLKIFSGLVDCVGAGGISCMLDFAAANFIDFFWFFFFTSGLLLVACVYLRHKLSLIKGL